MTTAVTFYAFDYTHMDTRELLTAATNTVDKVRIVIRRKS